MIVAAGKATRAGRVAILVVGLTPQDRLRLERGGGITREFSEIDPSLGEGTLLVAGVSDETTFVEEMRKRFDVVEADREPREDGRR